MKVVENDAKPDELAVACDHLGERQRKSRRRTVSGML